MMRKRIAVTALLFLILKIGSVTAQISIIPNGGISRNAAKRSYDWKQGFSIGVQIFTPISNTFFLGGRIVYNSWPAAGDNWLNKYSEFIGYRYDLESISGHHSVIELIPSLRLATSKSDKQAVRLFFQFGAGLFILGMSDITVEGSYSDSDVSSTMKYIYGDGYEEEHGQTTYYGGGSSTWTTWYHYGGVQRIGFKPGIQAGFVLSIARFIEIQPLLSYIFTSSKYPLEYKNTYYTVNLGIRLGK